MSNTPFRDIIDAYINRFGVPNLDNLYRLQSDIEFAFEKAIDGVLVRYGKIDNIKYNRAKLSRAQSLLVELDDYIYDFKSLYYDSFINDGRKYFGRDDTYDKLIKEAENLFNELDSKIDDIENASLSIYTDDDTFSEDSYYTDPGENEGNNCLIM